MFIKRLTASKSLVPGGNSWFLLLICLFGYTTLNRGFAYIGSYPFFIGEFTLFSYFLIMQHTLYFPRFFNEIAGKIWVIFFLYNFLVFLNSAQNDLTESIRNSIFWVYSLYFYIGYSYGICLLQKRDIHRFQRFLIFCGKAVVLYYSIYPLREVFIHKTMFLHHNSTALIGYYSTLHALAISFSVIFIYYRRSLPSLLWSAIGLFSIVLISQSRGALLATLAVLAYSAYFARKIVFHNIKKLLASMMILISFYALSGIAIEGERGIISSELFRKSASSIFIESVDDSFDGSRRDRLLWWEDVTTRTLSSLGTAFFGMGFDTILVDRATGIGTILRYPHNSFVSVFGFSGFFGLILYLGLIMIISLKIFKSSRFKGSIELLNWYPVFAISFFISAFFSTVLEAPFHSFVFWIITGIAYRIAVIQIKSHCQCGLRQKLKNA